MKSQFILSLFLMGFITFANPVSAQNQATALLKKTEAAMGGWNKLYKQKDVEFTYLYEYPGKQKDVSVERYIFEGEHSWAKYSTHEINVLPKQKGEAIQAVVNGKAMLTLDGKAITDAEAIGGAHFLRAANYYWFTMMYKLSNPGTKHNYLGTETVNGIAYEKVELSFDGAKTGKEANDVYILYINPETNLVDRFFFSLPAMGVNKPVILMEVMYTKMKGLQIPAKRNIYMPNKTGGYADAPSLVQTSSNIKFKNGFTAETIGR